MLKRMKKPIRTHAPVAGTAATHANGKTTKTLQYPEIVSVSSSRYPAMYSPELVSRITDAVSQG